MNQRGEVSFIIIGQVALILISLGAYYTSGIYAQFVTIFGSVFANVIGIGTIVFVVHLLGRQAQPNLSSYGGPIQ